MALNFVLNFSHVIPTLSHIFVHETIPAKIPIGSPFLFFPLFVRPSFSRLHVAVL